ncbi:MAG: C40 family peptidase [Burkholderiales bacterium]
MPHRVRAEVVRGRNSKFCYSFSRVGLLLPRDTRSLRRVGSRIDSDELTRGDLVFFDQEGKKSSHVGIYLGDGAFVHAPSSGGTVRVDRLDMPYWQIYLNEARRIRFERPVPSLPAVDRNNAIHQVFAQVLGNSTERANRHQQFAFCVENPVLPQPAAVKLVS